MRERKGRRRRSKLLWVREASRRELHAIAATLLKQDQADGMSRHQEWLFAQIMVELAYRRSHASQHFWCTCHFCTPSDRWFGDRFSPEGLRPEEPGADD